MSRGQEGRGGVYFRCAINALSAGDGASSVGEMLAVLATTSSLLGASRLATPMPATPVVRFSPPCMSAAPSKLRIGLVGGGTVGGGVVTILQKTRKLQESLGIDVEIATICVRDKSKKRDFDVPAGCTLVEDLEQILSDESIKLVCEVMGGTTLAKDVIMRSIKAGKHVVTANKALIAQDLPAIESLLKTVT